MRYSLLTVCIILLLSGCADVRAPIVTPSLASAPMPSPSISPVPPMATPTPTRQPTSTSVPTFTPSPTLESWIVSGQRYYFPVQPPGGAVYADEHHDYPATDIFVPIGSVVVAVTAGVVDEVSRVDQWDARTNDGAYRGGLWVTIVGDDGVRYHTSHLSAVEPGIDAGVRVHAGQIIGRSGNTGNATLTPPHVHFGISHPTFPGDWAVRRGEVWPYEYLQAWTHGEDVAPALVNR